MSTLSRPRTAEAAPEAIERRVLDGVEMRLHLLIEATALVGQRHRARGAVEQADAERGSRGG